MPDETPGLSLARLHEGSQITAAINKIIALVILRKTRHTVPENLGKLPSKHVSFKDWGGPNFHSSPIFLECQLLFAVYFFLVLLLEAQPEV